MFTITIAVFLLIISNGIQGQTTQTQLEQLKLWQQNVGTWQADHGKDTMEVVEIQPYGKATIQTAYYIIKGQKTPYYMNSISFNPKEGKFYGFVLWPAGGKGTWTGSFVSEKKFSGEFTTNFNPEKVIGKFEQIYESPSAITWHYFNMNGVMTQDLKSKKVK